MQKEMNHSTTYTSLKIAAQYQHWKVFAELLNGPGPIVNLICAVYSKRKNALLFPGSNLKKALDMINTPNELSDLIRAYSPDPLHGDNYAGGVVCKLILERRLCNENEILICPIRKTGINPIIKTFSKELTNLTNGTSLQEVTLLWPDAFLELLESIFDSKEIFFIAFPLFPFGEGYEDIEHVALVYFNTNNENFEWLTLLKNIMLFSTLTNLSEQYCIQERRLFRLLNNENRPTLTKFNSPEESESLIAQGERQNDLQKIIKSKYLIFPKATINRTSTPSFYLMPKYDLPSFRRLLLNPNQLEKKDINSIVARLVDALGNEIYLPTKKSCAIDTSIESLQSRFDRSSKLVEILKKIENNEPIALPSRTLICTKREVHKYLLNIFAKNLSDQLVVRDDEFYDNGYLVRNLNLEELKKNLKNILSCPYQCELHGDLHFDNLLVDSYFPEEPFFVLVDSNPKNKIGDPAIDIGKLIFSCFLGYDFVDAGHFDLNIIPISESIPFPTIQIKIPYLDEVHRNIQVGAVAGGLISNELSLPEDTPLLYDEATNSLFDAIKNLSDRLEDETLTKRSFFYAAIFCLTLNPFHIISNSEGSLALYMRGYKLYEDLLYEHSSLYSKFNW